MPNRPARYAERKYLSLIEILIMVAMADIGIDATAIEIKRLITERTARSYDHTGPIHAVLRRMERRFMVVSRVIERKGGTTGRLPFGFTMTTKGAKALETSLKMIDGMRQGMDFVVVDEERAA